MKLLLLRNNLILPISCHIISFVSSLLKYTGTLWCVSLTSFKFKDVRGFVLNIE